MLEPSGQGDDAEQHLPPLAVIRVTALERLAGGPLEAQGHQRPELLRDRRGLTMVLNSTFLFGGVG